MGDGRPADDHAMGSGGSSSGSGANTVDTLPARWIMDADREKLEGGLREPERVVGRCEKGRFAQSWRGTGGIMLKLEP